MFVFSGGSNMKKSLSQHVFFLNPDKCAFAVLAYLENTLSKVPFFDNSLRIQTPP